MTNGNDAVVGQGRVVEGGYRGQVGGLTKREYFAALAMTGLTQHLFADPDTSDGGYEGSYRALVGDAVSVADALIAALNTNGK